ncbi:MAG: branched-chain amino acid ABC transporter permease, partial [Proteobacteria bacterium]|nr:branched-chain amino acid ABC transporter permease [Pseudomonadota bacterium]
MDLLLQTLANGIVLGAGYAVIALGLTLVFGILGIVNFAHGAYFTIGAYSVVVVSAAGVPYLAAVMLAVLVVAAVGLLTELTVVRRGLYGEGNHGSIIVTFALGQALVAATLLIFGPDPLPVSSPFGDSSVKLFGVIVAGQRAFIFVASLAVLAMFGAWLRYTVRGQQVLAVAQNPKGALYSGINVPVIRTLSFVLGVAAAGLAGGLLAPIVTAYPTMGDAALVTSFTVVILGGLGSISGALIGAFLIGIASALFDTYVAASWTPALGWMLVVAVLLLWPQGLRGRAQANR